MKRYLMAISDGVFTGTGFSEELRHILLRLAQLDNFVISWQALQHVGFPMTVTDTMFGDIPNRGGKVKVYGTYEGFGPVSYGASMFLKNYREINPEMVLFLGDPKNIRYYVKHKEKLGFPFIFYCTLDGLPIHPQWKQYLDYVNLLVCMTEWAQKEFRKVGYTPAMIHHGINWKWWKVNRKEKQKIREEHNIPDDCVVYVNWDIPQHRKRTDALLRCWKKFTEEGNKNAVLLLYSDWNMGGSLGWNIEDLIQQYNVPRDNIISPIQIQGSPKYWYRCELPEQLKYIVCMGDVYVSTTAGEGFGKCGLEAMGMGMPVIITDYAASSEVHQKGSILVPCYKGRAGRFRLDDQRRSVEAGIVNEEKFVEAMQYLYDNEKERKRLGKEAREWSKTFDYDLVVVRQWEALLSALDTDLLCAKELLNL